MKALIALLLVGFTSSAHAVMTYDETRYPFLQCKNGMLQVSLIAMPNQKDVQLVINDLRLDRNPNVVYNAVVRPVMVADQHIYMNGQASIRVLAEGKSMRGYLNMDRTRPSVEQILECQTYFRILGSTY